MSTTGMLNFFKLHWNTVFCVACRSSQTADESANRNKSSKQLAAINNLKEVMVTMGLFKLVPYFSFSGATKSETGEGKYILEDKEHEKKMNGRLENPHSLRKDKVTKY